MTNWDKAKPGPRAPATKAKTPTLLRMNSTQAVMRKQGKQDFAGQVEMPHVFFREEGCLDVEPEYCFVVKKPQADAQNQMQLRTGCRCCDLSQDACPAAYKGPVSLSSS